MIRRIMKSIFHQFFEVERNMKDKETGLCYHAYDSEREDVLG